MAAERVVVDSIPYAFATWTSSRTLSGNLPWWSVIVHERALTLGATDTEAGIEVIGPRYCKLWGALPVDEQPAFRWDPSQWPFPAGRMPLEDELRLQATALHRLLRLVHADQCRRTVPALMEQLATIDMPCDAVHARLTVEGIPLPDERAAALHQGLSDEMAQLAATLAGFGLHQPDSDGDIWCWLIVLGLAHLFKDGSIDADTLKEFDAYHPAFKPLRRYRRLAAMRDQGWLHGRQTGPDGRLHPMHRTLGAHTGRTSTLDPALGSVPKEYRAAILTPGESGWVFDDADYSGCELFTLAAITGDERLAACCRTQKPVAALAQVIFPELRSMEVLKIPELARDLYDRAKIIVYSVIYGRSPLGLSRVLRCDEYEAGQLLNRLHAHCPVAIRHLHVLIQHSRHQHTVPIANGLVRHLQPDEIRDGRRVDRIAANCQVQGTAATVFRAATIAGDHVIRQHGGHLRLPLHDGLLYVAPEAAMPDLVPRLQRTMQDVFGRCMGTDLVPPVSSAWEERLRARRQPKALAVVDGVLDSRSTPPAPTALHSTTR
jgi:DNA polymerase-1